MDHTILIKQYRIEPVRTDDDSARANLFSYEPNTTELYQQRGVLYAIIEATTNPDNELDLNNIIDETYKTLHSTYYDSKHGSSLESLEYATNQALDRADDLSKKNAQVRVAAVSIWGASLIFANPSQLTIAIRRNNELFEVDTTPYGTDTIKNDDLIFLGNQSLYRETAQLCNQEYPDLPNPDIFKNLAELTSSQLPILGFALLAHVDTVPGKEEVIEIKYPEDLEQEQEATSHQQPNKPSRNWLKKFFIGQKEDEPEIYLPQHKEQKQQGKLMAIVALVLLLIGSITATYLFNQQKKSKEVRTSALDTIKEQLMRADELSLLNKTESLQLVDSAQKDLGNVLGSTDTHETPEEITSIESHIESIQQTIFNATEVIPTPENPPTEVIENTPVVSENGIRLQNGNTILPRQAEWQTPRTVATYFGNLYILDPMAQQIWKYVENGGQYGSTQTYFSTQPTMDNTLDLAIDGSIYVLSPHGVQKYTAATRDEFKLSGTYPEIEPNALLTTNTDTPNLFISHSRGILVFDKDGRYQKLLTSPQLQEVQDLYITPTDGKLWIKTASQWFFITPEQM